MTRQIRVLIHVCVCIVLLMSHLGSTTAAQSSATEGRYIVLLRGDTKDPAATAKGLSQRINATIKLDRVFSSAIKGFAGRFPTRLVAALAKDPRVVTIDIDHPVSITAQTLPTGVDRIGADRSATAAIDGVDTRVTVDVAVLDTGVGPHPDLNVVGGKDCSNTGSYADDNGHGTHVGGIIGALDNDTGVVGVAPGVRLWSVKVLNRYGSGTWSNIICGIDWVTANKNTIAVANMSFGGSGTAGTSCASSSLRQAICNSVSVGVTYVAGAGNSAKNVSTFVPAAFPEVISVSALADFNGIAGGGAASTCRADMDDGFATFSNFGAGVTIAAPGSCILSTGLNGGLNTMSGTSMASPHVAGAAALDIAVNGRTSPATVKANLIAGRERMSMSGDPDGIDEGVVHVGAPNQAPTISITAPTADATLVGSVTLEMTASDADDLTTTLTVAYQVDTGSFVPASYNPTSEQFEGTLDTTTLPEGTHTLTARATDRDGASSLSEPVVVTIQNTNAPPSADAGPDQTIRDTGNDGIEAVVLDGSGSTDPDGTIVSYDWANGETTLASEAQPTVDLPIGSHTVTLTVTDSRGSTGTDEVVVVITANQLPIAAAGPDQTLSDPDGDGSATVTLDGSASTDPDGSLASYRWSEGEMSLSTDITASVSLGVGTHTLTLLVTDNDGATASDEVIITVDANQAPVARAGSAQTVRDTGNDGFETIALDGSTSTDLDGVIDGYVWTEAGATIATGATPTVSLSVGTHALILTVMDDGGATTQDTVTITIVANQPPTAHAGSDQTIGDNDGDGLATVTLDGTGSGDPDGQIDGYHWTENGQALAHDAVANVTLGVGQHNIVLSVTDNDGATATDSVVVTVNVGPPAAPTKLMFGGSSVSVTFRWVDNAINETGYRLYRSTDGGATWTIVTSDLPANTTRYTDSSKLTRGVTYKHYVVAYNSSGESARSNIVTFTR